eukprot:10890520-Ditylum_brightwellii.AAC.1
MEKAPRNGIRDLVRKTGTTPPITQSMKPQKKQEKGNDGTTQQRRKEPRKKKKTGTERTYSIDSGEGIKEGQQYNPEEGKREQHLCAPW